MPSETGAEILARIKPRLDEDWIEVCLRPDLTGRLEVLEADLTDAQLDPKAKRRADGTTAESRRIAKEIQDIEAEVAASAVRFVFRGLPRDKFRALCDDHPPRRTDQYDLAVGYNRESLADALVRASMIEPAFDDDSWADLTAVVNVGEWHKLREYAEKVNGSVVTESPKSALASRILASPGSASKPSRASE